MSPCKWGAAAAQVSMDTGENLMTAFVYTTVLTYIGSEVAVGHVSFMAALSYCTILFTLLSYHTLQLTV